MMQNSKKTDFVVFIDHCMLREKFYTVGTNSWREGTAHFMRFIGTKIRKNILQTGDRR